MMRLVAKSLSLRIVTAAMMLVVTTSVTFSEENNSMEEENNNAGIDSLYEALASAYNTHPRLKAQREALHALDEGVAQAVSGWRPSAAFAYQRGRQRTSFDDADWSYANKKVSQISVSQPLFRGGQTWSSTKAAKALVKAGRAELLGSEQDILLDAVVAYMDLVQAQSVLELSRNNVAVLEQQLKAARQRFEVGEVTRTDVAQSEARVAQANSDRIEAEGSLESARAAYERIIGIEPGNASLPVDLPETPETLKRTIDAAIENNPATVITKHRKIAADHDVDSQIGALLPQLSLDASMRRDEGTGISGASKFDTDAVLVNLSVPIYQSGAQHSRVRAAKNIWAQRKYEHKDAEHEVKQDAIQAWENLQTSRATLLSNQAAIDAAKIALDGVKQEHQYGTRTTLDVLNAEQELFITQVNMVRAQRNEVVSIFNLISTIGKLSATELKLPTNIYDHDEHYDNVKYKFIGF